MTLTIDLPSDLEQSVRQQAARRGQDVRGFVLQAVQEKVSKARTFDEICRPFVDAVAATRMTEQEFDAFFEEARTEAWQQKQVPAQ